jgi:hypothetical protein
MMLAGRVTTGRTDGNAAKSCVAIGLQANDGRSFMSFDRAIAAIRHAVPIGFQFSRWTAAEDRDRCGARAFCCGRGHRRRLPAEWFADVGQACPQGIRLAAELTDLCRRMRRAGPDSRRRIMAASRWPCTSAALLLLVDAKNDGHNSQGADPKAHAGPLQGEPENEPSDNAGR